MGKFLQKAIALTLTRQFLAILGIIFIVIGSMIPLRVDWLDDDDQRRNAQIVLLFFGVFFLLHVIGYYTGLNDHFWNFIWNMSSKRHTAASSKFQDLISGTDATWFGFGKKRRRRRGRGRKRR